MLTGALHTTLDSVEKDTTKLLDVVLCESFTGVPLEAFGESSGVYCGLTTELETAEEQLELVWDAVFFLRFFGLFE